MLYSQWPAQANERVVAYKLNIERFVRPVRRFAHLKRADDERTYNFDLGDQGQLATKAVRQGRSRRDEVRSAIACHPEVRGHVFHVPADLITPAAKQREKDADEEDGERHSAHRDSKPYPLREKVLPGDQ